MNLKVNLSILILFFLSHLNAQTLSDFGDISGTETILFNSVAADDGIIYFIDELPSNKLIKINWEGKVVNELILPFIDSLVYNGQLIRDGDAFYLVGRQQPFPDGTAANAAEIWNTQVRSVVRFNADLIIEEIKTYDLIPFGGGEGVSYAGGGASTTYPTTIHIKNSQVRAVWVYLIFDTTEPIPPIIGRQTQYETINLNTDEASVKILPDVQSKLDAIYRENDFYLYGEVSDTIINGTAFNSRPVALYNNNGDKIALYSFDQFGSGAFSSGSIGAQNGDRIYSAYLGIGIDEGDCSEDNLTIDLRDTTFNLIKRFKLPECGLFASGKNSFAFASNGDLYISSFGLNKVGIFRFDADLNLLCYDIFPLQNERPLSLKITPDDQVILELLANNSVIKLYQYNCDLTTNTNSVSTPAITITPTPNPTSGHLYLKGLPATAWVDVFSATGQLMYSSSQNTPNLDLSNFANGFYTLLIWDQQHGVILANERIIKF